MTMPIAVATTQVAWGYSLSPNGYRSGNSSVLVADMLQWAGNYLTLCQNGTSYAVQVSQVPVQQQQQQVISVPFHSRLLKRTCDTS